MWCNKIQFELKELQMQEEDDPRYRLQFLLGPGNLFKSAYLSQGVGVPFYETEFWFFCSIRIVHYVEKEI